MEELTQILGKLESMKDTDLKMVNPDSLVDINEITYDSTLSKNEQLIDFVRQVKNPYCYKCGKLIIKASYNESGATLEDKLESYLLSL